MRYDNWLKWKEREEERTNVHIPDVTKADYEQRDRDLKSAGILEWERKWLVSHKFDSEGIQRVIADRDELRRASKISFANWNNFQTAISDYYRKNKWVFKDGRFSPFKLLEHTKDRDSISTTPQPKIGNKPTDFATVKKATLEADAKREAAMQRARDRIAQYPRFPKE